jgi:hypothetical protein
MFASILVFLLEHWSLQISSACLVICSVVILSKPFRAEGLALGRLLLPIAGA